jgi:hypothetical protein
MLCDDDMSCDSRAERVVPSCVLISEGRLWIDSGLRLLLSGMLAGDGLHGVVREAVPGASTERALSYPGLLHLIGLRPNIGLRRAGQRGAAAPCCQRHCLSLDPPQLALYWPAV